MTNQIIEQAVEEIVSTVETVEFLHGVPVNLPSQYKADLRGVARKALQAQREAGARAEAEWWSNHAQKLSAAIASSKDIVDAERLGLKYAKKHVARLKALTPPTK